MRKRKSYLHGAMLLLCSGLAVKLLGALFKIPLTNLIGDSGMGLFSFSMQFFSVAFVLCAAGIPIAESCLVSEALALGRLSHARTLVLRITCLFTLCSTVVSAGLFLGAEPLAALFGESEAAGCLRMIAPAIALVTAEAGLRGWYQGTGNMEPTSTSQVLEAVGKLLFGLYFARKALECGFGIREAAAGAVLGVTIGELCALLYLLWSVRRGIVPTLRTHTRQEEGTAKRFLSLMLPVTLGAAVMTASGFLDMALMFRRLPLAGMTPDAVTAAYGAYTGMALTLYHLPQAFASAVAVSILPALSAAWAKRQMPACQRLISSAVRLTLLVGVPCGAILTVFAQPLLLLLFPSQPHGMQTAEPLLALLGLSEAFVGLSAVTTSMLQAVGRADLSVCSTFAGCAAKFAVSYVWMADPNIGLRAAPLSTLVCFAVILLLDFFFLHRRLGWHPQVFRPLFRCYAAACGMAFSGIGIYQSQLAIRGMIPSLALAFGAMIVIYAAMLVPLGGWQAEDLALLPFGSRLLHRRRTP